MSKFQQAFLEKSLLKKVLFYNKKCSKIWKHFVNISAFLFFHFLPAAKPSRSRSGESPPPPGGKNRIEYLGGLILTVSMVIGPTKFISDLKLDQQSCSGPSRGATRASSPWWKEVEGQKSHHRRKLG